MTKYFNKLLKTTTDCTIVSNEGEQVIEYKHLTFYAEPLVKVLALAIKQDCQTKGVGRALETALKMVPAKN